MRLEGVFKEWSQSYANRVIAIASRKLSLQGLTELDSYCVLVAVRILQLV